MDIISVKLCLQLIQLVGAS